MASLAAAMLLEPYGLFQGTRSYCASSFPRLRHLRLMIDPTGCCIKTLSQLDDAMTDIGYHSQLTSLYIGFLDDFCCDIIGADAEDSISLCLSHMQNLKSVHLNSFWPARLELPTGVSLHATFESAPGQKHPGLWAGRLADVQNPRLPLRSVHFLPGSGLGGEHEITAQELWPLKVKRNLGLVRVRAETLHLALSDYPGLMQAERVLITASHCHLEFPSKQMASEHLKLEFPEELRVAISNAYVSTPQIDHLIITRKDPTYPLSVLLLRNVTLAAEDELSVDSRPTVCQPGCRKKRLSYGWCYRLGFAPLAMGFGTMSEGDWAHAVRCCCHACLACLHREDAAAFPEAIAQEKAMFGG